MAFPTTRPRRLRATPAWRALVAETRLSANDLVYPLFVVPGAGVANPVASMPGVAQLSIDRLVEEARRAHALGVPAVILFGIPEAKDPVGSAGYTDDGIVPRAIRALKRELPDLLVWADVCLCEYTSHGHCGLLAPDGSVDNDATLPLLARAAVAYARAGADAVAPSDMMDGRVGALRAALDAAGFAATPIVAYAAKYASAFYGPFREAAQSAPQFGDRRGYQMDPPNAEEALREVALDLEEGADIVLVKPAGPYLDIVRRVKETFRMPTAAYQVSGEYSLIQAAAERGWVDRKRIVLESLVGIKRAGADIVLTYFAPEVAAWLGEGTGGPAR
jgi:porphobilinogen synthase